jgi:acetyl/propionyl-CoA carboxylase alpha subunit
MNYAVSEKKCDPVTVSLLEVGEGVYDITVDGHTARVDAVSSGRTIYSVIEEGRQWEAIVDERGAHGFDVLVGGRLFHLEAEDERSQRLAQTAKATAVGPQTVTAEMPGRVIKLEVAVGDQVSEGQGVVIVEAMKMENEILSPIDGQVTGIAVREGDTVEMGATLFTVEPQAP